jgi:uncharacterized ion transporter superfamily protein YfcC
MILWGVTQKRWYLEQISGVFIAVGIVSGRLSRMSFSDISKSFVDGMRDLVGVAFLLGLSKGIVILATQGKIIDTVLYALSLPLHHCPKVLSALFMFMI